MEDQKRKRELYEGPSKTIKKAAGKKAAKKAAIKAIKAFIKEIENFEEPLTGQNVVTFRELCPGVNSNIDRLTGKETSFPAFAAMNGLLDNYKRLRSMGYKLTPEENLMDLLESHFENNGILREWRDKARKKFIKAEMDANFNKFAKKPNLQGNYIENLTQRSHPYVSTIGRTVDDFRNKIGNSLADLDSMSEDYELILRLAATCKDLRMVFDLSHEYLDNLVCQLANKQIDGRTYHKRQLILLGALHLSENAKIVKVVLIHELGHLVINIVYGSVEARVKALPYRYDDPTRKALFKKAFVQARDSENRYLEEEIDNIFKPCYDGEEKQMAELIVRVLTISFLSSEDESRLKDAKRYFPLLFDFFYDYVVPDLKTYLENQ